MKRVLVLHALTHRMRQTTFEFAMAFGRYAPADCEVIYQNIRDPRPVTECDEYDALFLTYDLLGLRSASQWGWVVDETARIRERCDTLVAFPQDDYTHNKALDAGLRELRTDIIYTPIESGTELVYPTMTGVADIRHAHTGYVDEAISANRMSSWVPLADRSTDVGTRVRILAPWLGRSGRKKGLFAELFAERGRHAGMRVDISTDDEDVFLGEAWYDFLGSCRTTIGQKGGASLCDPDGSVMKRVQSFLADQPDASFDEVEAACFPGLDGQAEMSAISPRLFDAAMLGTAQILVEDNYLDLLEPWVHYIPTDQDVSNIDEIAAFVDDPGLVGAVADAAAEVLIREERFTYRTFVDEVMRDSVVDGQHPSTARIPSIAEQIQWRVTPDLFEGVQHLVYLARATESTKETARLARDIKELVESHPAVVTHLDEELYRFLHGWQPIHPAIDSLAAPVIDLLRECGRRGALRLIEELIAEAAREDLAPWNFLDWTNWDQVELMLLGEPLG